MITKRVIPCLDVKDGRVVKGVNFKDLSDVSSPVELGRYDEAADVYEILSGLSEQDYVAVPDDSVCIEGAPTTKTEQGGAK